MVTIQSARTFILAAMLVLVSAHASATNFDVSHLATELNRVSNELAQQLRNSRGYSSVRFSANQLSKESAELIKAIGRGRSVAAQQAAFKRVARRYRELEAAFLRSSPEHDRVVYNQVGVLSNLFSSLNSEFYYTNYVEPSPRYYYTPPVVRRSQPLSRYDRRGLGLGGGFAGGNVGGSERSRNPRPGYRPNTMQVPYNNFSHRSPVLERQQRLQGELNRNSILQVPRYRGP